MPDPTPRALNVTAIRALLAAIERGASGPELDALCGSRATRMRWQRALATDWGVRIHFDRPSDTRVITDWGVFRRQRLLAPADPD